MKGFEPSASWSQTKRSSQAELHPGNDERGAVESVVYGDAIVVVKHGDIPSLPRPQLPAAAAMPWRLAPAVLRRIVVGYTEGGCSTSSVQARLQSSYGNTRKHCRTRGHATTGHNGKGSITLASAPPNRTAEQIAPTYCDSVLQRYRRHTRTVMVGRVGVGGDHPIRVQSMTTTRTQDIEATVAQAIRLVEVGCEIVRITAPTVHDARAIGEIRAALRGRGIDVPLVADIHFSPAAAMEAVAHVDKVRINPGNYADSRKFAQRSYTDEEYLAELRRIEERFTPLVLKCKERGVAMRIGTNHGSLSDRIVNRYGDSPEGMAESALEFVRICERLGYFDIIMSMKASNPKVMIAAYRLLAARMTAERMAYPFHLGVTEAGNGEDARIKSAVGIGGLLEDGIGDTIRVSLAEEPEAEVPVARALAHRYSRTHTPNWLFQRSPFWDPFHYTRRATALVTARGVHVGAGHPPVVLGILPSLTDDGQAAYQQLFRWSRKVGRRAPQPDIALAVISRDDDLAVLHSLRSRTAGTVAEQLPLLLQVATPALARATARTDAGLYLVLDGTPAHRSEMVDAIAETAHGPIWIEITVAEDTPQSITGATLALLSAWRQLPEALQAQTVLALRSHQPSALLHAGRHLSIVMHDVQANPNSDLGMGLASEHGPAPIHLVFDADGADAVLNTSVAFGALLCDGIGDSISITGLDTQECVRLSYGVLQGSGARLSRTDYVACPSCGRTLFDLQSTTDRIKASTGHLKGVKLAIMGCVVNGPGEMADADFGYVGGSPGHVNLYVGKEVVERNVPEADADQRLVALIRAHGRWSDPEDVIEE